jgi:hypothetical protein
MPLTPSRASNPMKYPINGFSAGMPRRLQVRPRKVTTVRLKFAVFALGLNPAYRIIWRTLSITIGTTIACTTSPRAPDEPQTHRDGQSRIIGMIGVSANPVAVRLTNSMMRRRPAFTLGSSWLNRLPKILATLAKPAKATESSANVRRISISLRLHTSLFLPHLIITYKSERQTLNLPLSQRPAALGHKQPLSIISVERLVSAKSGHWDLTQVSDLPGQDQ